MKSNALPGLPAEAALERAAAVMLATDLQADPKKQGKEKKPDTNLVSRVFLEE